MKYFINLIDQSRSDFAKTNGWHQTYWELESKDQAINLHKEIYENVGKDYDLTEDEVAKAFKRKLNVTGVIFIEKENEEDSSDTAFRFSDYKKEAYNQIYEYLKQKIGEDKINDSIK